MPEGNCLHFKNKIYLLESWQHCKLEIWKVFSSIQHTGQLSSKETSAVLSFPLPPSLMVFEYIMQKLLFYHKMQIVSIYRKELVWLWWYTILPFGYFSFLQIRVKAKKLHDFNFRSVLTFNWSKLEFCKLERTFVASLQFLWTFQTVK